MFRTAFDVACIITGAMKMAFQDLEFDSLEEEIGTARFRLHIPSGKVYKITVEEAS